MLILISPAKTLDFLAQIPEKLESSIPYFTKESIEIIEYLRKFSPNEIAKLMSLSPSLSQLNYQRFQQFSFEVNPDNKGLFRQAIYAYKGDVYQGFDLKNYKKEDIDFANQYLRIISGLYGILKPLDLIQAYRLEMSTPLATKVKNLYDFWSIKITDFLNQETEEFIVNLASQEYSSAIIKDKINKPLINIVFKESYKNDYKIIGIHAKKARGIFANFIILNKLKTLEDLKTFCINGYKFMEKFSTKEEYVFVR